MRRMKRALILGTGGLRGAYFTGVHAALRHKKIDFDVIVGASAGALAGAWIAAGMHEQELAAWQVFSKYRIAWHPLLMTTRYKTVDMCIQLTTLKYIDLERVKNSRFLLQSRFQI